VVRSSCVGVRLCLQRNISKNFGGSSGIVFKRDWTRQVETLLPVDHCLPLVQLWTFHILIASPPGGSFGANKLANMSLSTFNVSEFIAVDPLLRGESIACKLGSRNVLQMAIRQYTIGMCIPLVRARRREAPPRRCQQLARLGNTALGQITLNDIPQPARETMSWS
jgi:hypothetical protein